MATISPTPKLQFLDANGNPLANGLLYTYSSGTTIPLATYTSQAQTTANTNPIVLDARGEASVYLLAGFSYRFVLQNSSGVTQYTTDPFNALGDMAFQNASAVSITGGTISGVTLNGPITGNITGNVNGDVTGNVTGNVTGGTVVAESYNGGQLAGLRNKIINGSMIVNQRGSSALTSSIGTNTKFNSTRMFDRWTYMSATTTVMSVTQQLDGPASVPSLQYSTRLTVTTPTVSPPSPTEYFTMSQIIEGYDARVLVNKTFTISFWVKSTVVGTYSLILYNGVWPSTDYYYLANYEVSASNVWEYKTITIINGLITTGANWNWTNGAGVNIGWTLVAGSSRNDGVPGSWTAGYKPATIDQVEALATLGNIFALTGVQVEVGNTATPFEHRPFGAELALCQRYYEKSFPYATNPAQNTGANLGAAYGTGQVLNVPFSTQVNFVVAKRTAPTITTYSPNAASANWETLAAVTPIAGTANIGENAFAVTGSTAVTAGTGYSIHWLANAEI